MNRPTHTAILSTLISCLAIASQTLCADELTLLNWEEYLADEVISAFEKESGHTIKTVVYDSDEKRDEILSSPAGKQFDLVVIDNTAAQLFGKNNLLYAIPPRQLKDASNIMPRWRESCGNFGTPYFWGTVGIAYRSDKLDFKPDSWRDLMTPREEVSGHIVMLLDFLDTLIPALKLNNTSISSEATEDLKAAFKALKQQKPHVLSYDFASSYLAQGEKPEQMYMALVYSGDQYTLNDGNDAEPWQYVIPKEGTGIWVDCLSIVESSTHKSAAMEFINFLNRAGIAAANANDIGSATANQAALPLLNKDISEDKTIYPPQKLLDNSELYRIISDKSLSQRNRIIRSIKK